MNSDSRNSTCDDRRDELVRLACDSTAVPSPELREHLANCPRCRRKLAADRQLLGDFGAALQPEPLSDELAARIAERLAAQTGVMRGRWFSALPVVGAAAAACLLIAFLVSRGTQPSMEDSRVRLGLTQSDETAIAEAYALLLWESADFSVDSLAERVEQAVQAVGRAPGRNAVLPWSADDDWDVPEASTESSGLNAVPEVCSSKQPDRAAVAAAGHVAPTSGCIPTRTMEL